MSKYELNSYDVNGDGRVILYQRSDLSKKTPKWHCRITVQGSTGLKRFSTKESDQRKAERYALERYQELYFKVRDGGSLQGKPFGEVYKEWCDYIDISKTNVTPLHRTSLKQRVRDTALKLFKNKPIDEITEGDLLDVMSFAKKNTPYSHLTKIKEPSSSTLRSTGFAIQDLLKYAKTKGFIKEIYKVPVPALVKNPRPDFTKDEWTKLYTFMRDWVDAEIKQSRGASYFNPRVHRERYYLQQWVLLMANTGIRVGEMRMVQWKNLDRVIVSQDDERLLISVDGKTGKRQVVANSGSENYIKRIYDFRTNELGKEPSKDEYIFCNVDGKYTNSYKGSFTRLLKDSGLWIAQDGQRRSPYSLRHTYATMRINEVPIYQLAINMGTSVEMIEDYYGHSRTSDSVFASTVTKGNQQGSSKVLPF